EVSPEQDRASVSRPQTPGGTATILVVEDDREVRHLIRQILIGLGYVVLEAANAEEAISAAKGYPKPIDLMVSAGVMPRLSGYELAKRMTTIRPAMKVLYISGYVDRETNLDAPPDVAAAYLQKPFGPTELAFKVAELIARSNRTNPG